MQGDERALSVGEAARALGISIPAVRKRIRRGSLRAYKVDGEWRVIGPPLPDAGRDAGRPEDVTLGEAVGQAALVQQLRSENEYLRGLVAELMRRVPELPAPAGSPEPPAAMPSTATEGLEKGPPSARPAEKAGAWWRRLLRR